MADQAKKSDEIELSTDEAESPKLELVGAQEQSTSLTDVAALQAGASVEISPEDSQSADIAPEDQAGNDLLASSLEAAIKHEATKSIMRPPKEVEDDVVSNVIEIPEPPANDLLDPSVVEIPVPEEPKAVEQKPTAPVLKPAPKPSPQAAPQPAPKPSPQAAPQPALQQARPALKVVAPPPAIPQPAPETPSILERAKAQLEKLQTLINKVPTVNAPDVSVPPRVSKGIVVFLAVVAAVGGTYGYFVYSKYNESFHPVWKGIVKNWKRGDVEAVKGHLAFELAEVPVFIIERYPHLALTNDGDFGAMIKRVHQVRQSAVELEFKKGFSSTFWDYQVSNITDYGDRVEIAYEKAPNLVTFSMEKQEAGWKLVDIDARKAPGLFEIDEADLRGVNP